MFLFGLIVQIMKLCVVSAKTFTSMISWGTPVPPQPVPPLGRRFLPNIHKAAKRLTPVPPQPAPPQPVPRLGRRFLPKTFTSMISWLTPVPPQSVPPQPVPRLGRRFLPNIHKYDFMGDARTASARTASARTAFRATRAGAGKVAQF